MASGDARDFVLSRTRELIRDHGWAVLGLDTGRCEDPGCTTDHATTGGGQPFYYTVGLTAAGLPELVLRGQPKRVAHPLLNALATQSTVAELVPGELYRVAAVAGVVLQVQRLDVSMTRTLCKVAKVLFGSRLLPALEVTVR
jgi:hypothetical protein